MSANILPEALAEMREAAQWYEGKEIGLGQEFYDVVEEAFVEIEQHPDRYARLETYRGTREIRRYLLYRFPYIVIYERLANEALIIAIAHERRRPNYWKSRG